VQRALLVALPLLTIPLLACGRSSVVLHERATFPGKLVVLPVRINDSPPLPFILDTGASTNVVDRRQAGSLGLAVAGGVDVTTGGGIIDASEIDGVTLRIGDATLRDVNAVAIDLSGLAAGLGEPVAGILGYDIFERYVVAIDYAGGIVTLHEPARYAPTGRGETVPIDVEEQVPFVRAQVPGINGPSEAKLELDTGKTGALTLLRGYVDANMLLQPGQPEVAITAGALLPGQVPATVTRIPALQIGRFSVRGVVTTVVPTGAAAGVGGDTVGILGAELLERFTVVIDYSRRQLTLIPRREADLAPLEFDMSGISLAAQGPEYRDHVVRMVIPGSPGAEAGVEIGDRLVAIDGRPSRELTLGEIRELLRKDGAHYALELQRGQAVVGADLRTRRLL
jgi:predicted aspartyl protease